MPEPPIAFLLVAKSATSVHDDPSHASVFPDTGEVPPAIKLAVCVPLPDQPVSALAVFKLEIDVQEVPSYSSVTLVVPGSKSPPKTTAAVCVPAPPN